MKKTVRNIFKTTFWMLAITFLLLQILSVIAALPAVQNQVIKGLKGYLAKHTQTEVELSRVDFALPARAVLEDVVIRNPRRGEEIVRMEALGILFNFELWDYLLRPDMPRHVSLSSLELYGPEIHLNRGVDSVFNLEYLLRGRGEDVVLDARQDEDSPGWSLDLSDIRIMGGRFAYRDSTRAEVDSLFEHRINFADVQLENVNGLFSLYIHPSGSLNLFTEGLSFHEICSGFVLQELTMHFQSDSLERDNAWGECETIPFVAINNLHFNSGQTHMHGDIRFEPHTLEYLFNDQFDESFSAALKPSQLAFSTLNYFLPKPLPLAGRVSIEGEFTGTPEEFESQQFSLNYLDQTRLSGRMSLIDYLEPDSLHMDLRLSNSVLTVSELYQLLPDADLPVFLDSMGRMAFAGLVQGRYYDFFTRAQIASDVGELDCALHLKLPSHRDLLAYEGEIEMRDFDLNRLQLVPTAFSKQLNLKGSISGEGTRLTDLNTSLEAGLSPSEILGYRVDSLLLSATVAEGKVSGKMALRDPQGNANLRVGLDLLSEIPQYEFSGELDAWDLEAYDFYKRDPMLLSGKVSADFSGDSLEKINGQISFAEATLTRKADTSQMLVPRFWLQTYNNSQTSKYINLKSSLLDADVTGAFAFATIDRVITNLLYESQLFFTNNDSLIDAYYAEKEVDTTTVDLKFAFAPRDSLNDLFRFLNQPVFVAPESHITGGLTGGAFEHVKIKGAFDSLAYDTYQLKHIDLDLELIKAGDRNMVITAAALEVDSLYLSGVLLERFNAELGNISGNDNTLQLDLFADQIEADNHLRLILTANLLESGGLSAQFDDRQSYFILKQDTLRVRPGNRAVFDQKELFVEALRIENGDRYLQVDGTVSRDPASALNLHLNRVRLELLNQLYPSHYATTGLLNADIMLRDLMGGLIMDATGDIENFALDDFEYGDLLLDSDWNPEDRQLHLDARLVDERADTTLRLSGYYLADNELSPLNFDVTSGENLPLNYIEPFVKTQLYGIEGSVGLRSFHISGRFDNLEVKGTGEFVDASFGITYFQTEYSFNGAIEFDKDRITFPRRSPIRLYDEFGKSADFYGVIRHRGMREFEFDLQLDRIQDFLVMDTKKEDNELFYGVLKVESGVASIAGNLEKLEIEAFALTGTGSNLRIPITDNREVGRPDFITFVGEDTGGEETLNTGFQGFDIRLNMITTQEAQVELIFDEKVGDIIRGRGNGNFSIYINEEGDFSMSGEYEIMKGEYLFTSQNILNKKFGVKPGGMIHWTGDPYSANIDLDAIYALHADIKDLVQLDRSVRVPVNVVMHMGGSLEKPEITPGIELPNLNNQDAIRVVSALRAVQYDEQELNKQVFSLMVFNRFAPLGGFLSNDPDANSGVVSTSVSELFTNQLNYWLSRAMNDKLSVAVGANNLQDVNLLISAKIFNDRVTIERDGNLVNSESGITLGNISVMVKLLPPPDEVNTALNQRPSELILEVFNRENLDVQYNSTNQTGIGVFYKKDFDSLRDLLKGADD